MNLQKNKPLKKLTTFRIGGPAKYFVAANDLDDLKEALSFAKKNKQQVFVLGAGSNTLASDKGFSGLVIKLTGDFCAVKADGIKISAGAGVCVSALLRSACESDLSGLEFMTGIPGTIGGALVMNAGVGKREIGKFVEWVKVVDFKGNVKKLKRSQLKFGYRKSALQKMKAVVVEAGFKLRPGSKKEISQNMRELMRKRLQAQPYDKPSAGSFFKNPKGKFAGQLIESAGCKGMRVGGAEVSTKHANFIINRKNAKASDVLALAKKVKERVRKHSGVNLQPEVIMVS